MRRGRGVFLGFFFVESVRLVGGCGANGECHAEMKNKREQQQTPGGGQPAVGVRNALAGAMWRHRPTSAARMSLAAIALRRHRYCSAARALVGRVSLLAMHCVCVANCAVPQRFGPPSEEAVSEAEEKRKLVGPPEIKAGEVR